MDSAAFLAQQRPLVLERERSASHFRPSCREPLKLQAEARVSGSLDGLGRCLPSMLAAALAGTSVAASRRKVRRRQRATAMDLDLDIITKKKVGDKLDEESETETSKDMWVVLVHAPIRNCRMPWCKIPGLKKVICTCLKEGVEPGGGIRSKDGKCALTIEQYTEVLMDGVPLLSRKKAYEVSQRLFESAMANPVGTAVVIGAFRKAAEEYHERLKSLGLWTSVQEVERD
eukprot:TRINITY_DN19121_c0_g1_i2.p1 TRINITY_DN19121_c0_g1~~TRINITY_DN19121_c0_g1_i2.p1  ORF type:complete len:230 (+),score=67.57 TRINITY_DN19121_c0_g1_i2:125-814(+)